MTTSAVVTTTNLGRGIKINSGLSKVEAPPSADAGNRIVFGTDNYLKVPAATVALTSSGNVITSTVDGVAANLTFNLYTYENIRTITSGAILSTDNVVYIANSSSTVTVTLPTAVGILGRKFTLCRSPDGANNASTGTITVNSSGGRIESNVNGTFGVSTTLPVPLFGGQVTPGIKVTFQSDNADWRICNN